jgi:hypothetical protein
MKFDPYFMIGITLTRREADFIALQQRQALMRSLPTFSGEIRYGKDVWKIKRIIKRTTCQN